MEGNMQSAKMELIQWLTTVEDSNIIQKIFELRNSETKDWWDDISEAEKKSIQTGVNEVAEGKLNSNSKAQQIYGKWL